MYTAALCIFIPPNRPFRIVVEGYLFYAMFVQLGQELQQRSVSIWHGYTLDLYYLL